MLFDDKGTKFTLVHACGVAASFLVTAVMNGLISSGVGVPLTNPEIADSHPVFIMPAGYAFSIWGIIYALVAVFCVMQLFPMQLKFANPPSNRIRQLVMLSFLFNNGWLILFSFEIYWIALVLILGYCLVLHKILVEFNVNYLNPQQGWRLKLMSAAFSLNAAWVTAATALQTCLNLMEEGWLVSADFTLGVIFVLSCVACYISYARCDVAYAAGSAWALGGIISRQQGAAFAMRSAVCHPACIATMKICQAGGLFYSACQAYDPKDKTTDARIIEPSNEVIVMCYFSIAAVLVALIIGISYQLLLRNFGNKEKSSDRELGVALDANSTAADAVALH